MGTLEWPISALHLLRVLDLPAAFGLDRPLEKVVVSPSWHEIELSVLEKGCCSAFFLTKTGTNEEQGAARSGVEPGVAVDKSLPSRRLAGAYRRPGAVGAVAG